MRKPFTFQFLLIFFKLLSVLMISHGSFEAESDPLSSNDKLTNKRLSKERETWRKKKEKEPPFEYHGLVLTTIDVKTFKGSKKVQFSGAIEANLEDQTAVFLHNIVETDMKDNGMTVFEAELADIEAVSRLLKGKKILISVHGHGREPLPEFEEVKKASKEFKHHEIIPLFWPTFDLTWQDGIKKSYYHDVAVAEASGRALATALNKMVVEDDLDCDISIMVHSMGSRVLEFFADQAHDLGLQIKFRNIYMVAADIDRDVFENNRGKYIVDMLSSDSGKVYVAFRWNDSALATSAILLNGEKRLGQAGVNSKHLPSDLHGKVKNINMAGFPADASLHNYNYENYLIWFYDSK